MFITGVDTSEKLFIGVNDTGEIFTNPCHRFSVIAGVVVTGDNWSPVSLIPGINLSPVSTTLVTNYCR
jgi:hypothetical protein